MSRIVSRFLQRYWRVSRGLTLEVRTALTFAGGRVLLVHEHGRGWCLPGGMVEKGETVAAAALRTLSSEAPRRLDVAPRLFAVYRAPHGAASDHVALVVLSAEEPAGIALTGRPTRVAGLGEPPPGTDPATEARLAELAGRATPAPHW